MSQLRVAFLEEHTRELQAGLKGVRDRWSDVDDGDDDDDVDDVDDDDDDDDVDYVDDDGSQGRQSVD